jgi:hypothetical protein
MFWVESTLRSDHHHLYPNYLYLKTGPLRQARKEQS